jgi:hypothetical protein
MPASSPKASAISWNDGAKGAIVVQAENGKERHHEIRSINLFSMRSVLVRRISGYLLPAGFYLR